MIVDFAFECFSYDCWVLSYVSTNIEDLHDLFLSELNSTSLYYGRVCRVRPQAGTSLARFWSKVNTRWRQSEAAFVTRTRLCTRKKAGGGGGSGEVTGVSRSSKQTVRSQRLKKSAIVPWTADWMKARRSLGGAASSVIDVSTLFVTNRRTLDKYHASLTVPSLSSRWLLAYYQSAVSTSRVTTGVTAVRPDFTREITYPKQWAL